MVLLGVVKIIVCFGFQPQCVLVKYEYEVLADYRIYIYVYRGTSVGRSAREDGRPYNHGNHMEEKLPPRRASAFILLPVLYLPTAAFDLI